MNTDNLERRVEKLEQQDAPGIRVVLVQPGDPEPVQQPGEQLIVLRSADMGEPADE